MKQRSQPIPFTPVYKRVVVEPLEAESKSAGGIIIPDAYQQRANRGKLVAAGLGALDVLHSHGIELGDVVLFGKYAGVWEEWRQPGATSTSEVTKLLVLQVDDILASEGLADRDTNVGIDGNGHFVLTDYHADKRVDPKAA